MTLTSLSDAPFGSGWIRESNVKNRRELIGRRMLIISETRLVGADEKVLELEGRVDSSADHSCRNT